MDEVIAEMAAAKNIEFAGNAAHVDPPVTARDKLGNLSLMWEAEGIQAQLNQIERRRDGVHCFLSFRQRDGQKWRWLYAATRINLSSVTARTSLRRELEDRNKIAWKDRIDQIVVAAGMALNDERKPVVLKQRSERTLQNWLLQPIAERNQHSMIFAKGGTGKSLVALALCASAVSDQSFIPGIEVTEFKHRALYLDWETDEETHELRLTQLCTGRGVIFPEDRIHYIRMDGPITDQVDYLHDYIVKNDIGLVVIDSVGAATQGDINTPEAALGFIRAIRALGRVTVLSITHIGWEASDRPFGSSYFWNGPRSIWQLKGEQAQGESESNLGLFHRKTNNGMYQADIGLKVEFSETAIRYYRQNLQATKLASDTPPRDQIMEILSNGRLRLGAIYDELPELQKATIRQTLARGVGKDFVKFGAGKDVEYGLISPVTVTDRHSDVTGRGAVTEVPPTGETLRVTKDTPVFGDKEKKENPSQAKNWWDD